MFTGLAQFRVTHVCHCHHHGERSNRGGKPESICIVRLLDGGGENALDADAVAAHDRRNFFAVGIKHARTHRLGVLVAELEDVSNLDGLAHDQLARAMIYGTRLALVDAADISGQGPREIATRDDVAQVIVLLVGAAHQVLAAFEGFVHDHGEPIPERLLVMLQTLRDPDNPPDR